MVVQGHLKECEDVSLTMPQGGNEVRSMPNPRIPRFSTSIAREIEQKRLEAGLRKEDLIRKMGYMNISEGLHRYDAFLNGKIYQPDLLKEFPNVLPISAERVMELYIIGKNELSAKIENFSHMKEQKSSGKFIPHGIIDTELSIPNPIFIAAIIGVEKLKRVDIDLSKPVSTYPSQVIAEISKRITYNGKIICFGKPTGFTINYSPNRAIQYDLEGNPIKEYNHAIRLGQASISVGGQKIPPFLTLE